MKDYWEFKEMITVDPNKCQGSTTIFESCRVDKPHPEFSGCRRMKRLRDHRQGVSQVVALVEQIESKSR